MAASTMRLIALAVFAGSIAGMIVSSIADSNGAAVTFGLVAAGAAVALISVTAATTGRLAPDEGYRGAAGPSEADDDEAVALEAHITALVETGADEEELRALVGRAIRFGRSH